MLINNEGYDRLEPFETTSEASFRDQIDVNFHGVIHLVRAALPSMLTKACRVAGRSILPEVYGRAQRASHASLA